MTSTPILKIRSQRARLARAAAVPFSMSPRARDAAAQLALVRDRLNAIEADSKLTPSEKDRAASTVLREARDRWKLVAIGTAAALEDARAAARRVAEKIRSAEAALSPLDLERLRRRAAALEAGDVGARAAAFEAAVDAGDVEALLAHAVLDPSPNAKYPLAATLAPADFASLIEGAAEATSTAALAQEVATGLDELAAEESAWRAGEANGRDLLEVANGGPRALVGVGERIDSEVAQHVPPGFAGLFRPPALARPAAAPQPSTPPATGAA